MAVPILIERIEMNEELKAAIERRRKNPGWKGQLFPYGNAISDAVLLADAYLAEHQEDDDELVTEQWLRENGFCNYRGWPQTRIGIETLAGLYLSWNSAENAFRLDCCLWEGSTRGDVRRLCKALGIELEL